MLKCVMLVLVMACGLSACAEIATAPVQSASADQGLAVKKCTVEDEAITGTRMRKKTCS